jgi:hypothetical protein
MANVDIDGQEVETSLSEATVILNLDCGKFTNRRKISSSSESIDTDIDRDSLHIGIDLIDAPELRACQNFQAQLKANLKPYIVPSFFRGGMYLVKLEAVQIVNDLIKQAKVDFVPVVQAFADVVDKCKEEAKARLKGEFDESLYPTRGQIMAVYRIEHSWLSMSTPTSLKKISIELFEQEKAKAEETIKAATDNITALLAAEAKGLSDHLIERLTPNEDGTVKQLRKSAVNNISSFLDTFKLRNIGTSGALESQILRMQELIKGVDAKDLRMNETLRNDIAVGFKEVTEVLDRLVIEKPKRYMATAEEAANG